MSKTTARSAQIDKLLREGMSVPKVAKKLKMTRRWVYEYSRERKLPRNRPITPNSPLERQVLRALVGTNGNIDVVARCYNQAPSNIMRLVRNLSARKGKAALK